MASRSIDIDVKMLLPCVVLLAVGLILAWVEFVLPDRSAIN